MTYVVCLSCVALWMRNEAELAMDKVMLPVMSADHSVHRGGPVWPLPMMHWTSHTGNPPPYIRLLWWIKWVKNRGRVIFIYFHLLRTDVWCSLIFVKGAHCFIFRIKGMREGGLLRRWDNFSSESAAQIDPKREFTTRSLTIINGASAFIILTSGLTLALLAFITEFIWDKNAQRRTSL